MMLRNHRPARSVVWPALWAFLLLTQCVRIPATTPPDVPPATLPISEPGASRVVLISYDGVGADDLNDLAQRGILSSTGYLRMVREGTTARRMIPVNPPLTAPAHTSMASGTDPNLTGIVSNTFHESDKPRLKSTRGFAEDIDTDTLWESAQRQGKRVGVITFPGVDGRGPRRTAEWGLGWVEAPAAKSRVLTLKQSDWKAHWYPPGWTPPRFQASYSPVMETTVSWAFEEHGWNVSTPMVLLAYDTTNDDTPNYDHLRIELDSGEVTIDSQRWFAVSREVVHEGNRYLYGSWSKILQFAPDLSRFRLYLGEINRNQGYPDSYREMIDRQAGFWPGPPDGDAAEQWLRDETEGIDPATFREQLERFAAFFGVATLVAIREMPFDLLLGYQPMVDEAEHQFRIVNDRQASSTPDRRAAGASVRESAYRAVDRSISEILAALGGNDAMVVVGDHGLAALDTSVGLRRLLVEWGYGKAEGDNLASDSPWVAFTSGSLAHLHGFEKRSEKEIAALALRLERLRSPDGAAVIERVARKTASSHPNTGDLVVSAYPRFSFHYSVTDPVFLKTYHYGQHGGLNHHSEYHTIFAAHGQGVPRYTVPEMRQTAVARYVSRLLGIEPPRNAE